MDPVYELIPRIMKARYEDLPAETADVLKNSVLDTLGVAIAGSSAEGMPALAALIQEWGGKGESGIIVYGGKVPAPMAALANSSMARARDFDEVHEKGGGHLSATTVPAAFAFAEYCKRPVSGKDFILFSALCSEIICRIRIATGRPRGWLSETFAPIGVAVMGGRLLGFDADTMLNAIGLAYAQCAGNGQAMLDGAMATRVQQGLGAKGGIVAALLAERGITGASNVFLGEYGLFPLYAEGRHDYTLLLDGFGERFDFLDASIKPYPCCKMAHTAISSAMELVREHNLKPGDISDITIATNSFAYNLCALGDGKYTLKTTQDAQFSIPYLISLAILRQKITFDDFTTEAIANHDVLSFAKKVQVVPDPGKDAQNAYVGPADVTITTVAGRRHFKHTEFVKGHPGNRFSFDECLEKFRECCRFAARPVPAERLDTIASHVAGLEQLDDVREIMKLLS